MVQDPSSDILAEVIFNHDVVYQGPVAGDLEWSFDAGLWGNIPMTLNLSGHGQVVWQDLHMNYSGCLLCLPGSESSGGTRVKPEYFYAPPSMQGDCRSQVTINGVLVPIHRDENCQGAWHYEITAPARVDAMIRIDRQRTMLWTPVI